jgi:hypothetical protein
MIHFFNPVDTPLAAIEPEKTSLDKFLVSGQWQLESEMVC